MAVKAADQITMTDMTDVKLFCRYYLLQSSTLAAPSKPTTNPPPSSWTKTEPSYTAGSTNSLYFTDLTVFSNDTFSYSDVSLSSSYEAAKTAYNKAVEAAKTATNYIDYSETDGLQVGNKQSGSWAGTRTQQTASAFNILGAAGEVLASYGAALVELGKNAANAVIKLCAGAGSIRVEDKSDEGMFENTMCLSSDRVSLEGAEFAGVNAESLIISMGGITTPEGTTQLATQKYHRRTYFNAVNDDVGMGHGDAFVKIGASKTEETDDVTTYHAASSVLITPESIHLQSDAVTVNGSRVCTGGFAFYSNPTVVFVVSSGAAYTDESGKYVLADSVTGETLLADTETYTTNTVEGDFYRIAGADSVSPFKAKIAYMFLGTRCLPSGCKAVYAYYTPTDGTSGDGQTKYTTTYANSITATITKSGVGSIKSASTSGSSHKITFTANKDLLCDIHCMYTASIIRKAMKSGETYTTTRGGLCVLVYE